MEPGCVENDHAPGIEDCGKFPGAGACCAGIWSGAAKLCENQNWKMAP